jgi:hypothetical protein
MMEEKGVVMSSFINKAMASFLELPDDPTQKLLRENIEHSAIRVRISYLNEIRSRIIESEQQVAQVDREKTKQKELIAELEKVGESLKKTSCYSKVLVALKTLDPEAPCWDTALQEINATNGDTFTADELWNKAIEWYRLYPFARS